VQLKKKICRNFNNFYIKKLIRNRLYGILSIACLTGYVWLFINLSGYSNENHACLMKYVTNIPCPSCGSTRAILSILRGKYSQGFYQNPFGYILILIIFITPIWLIYDFLKKRSTLLSFYNRTEAVLRRKYVYIPLVVLVFINWLWNIYKGL
jgi:hypothetical protein